MATTATRYVNIVYDGDVDGTQRINAASNADSPAQVEYIDLDSGANTINIPEGGTPVSVTILPPSGNSTSITFKGVTGDTGVRIHNTDPTTIAIHSSVTSFCLTAGGAITNLRLYWT